jgi:hypothetical protein
MIENDDDPLFLSYSNSTVSTLRSARSHTIAVARSRR